MSDRDIVVIELANVIKNACITNIQFFLTVKYFDNFRTNSDQSVLNILRKLRTVSISLNFLALVKKILREIKPQFLYLDRFVTEIENLFPNFRKHRSETQY